VGLLSADAAGRFAPNDGNAMGTYIERYVYDAVGNFLQMQHNGSDPVHPGWTRRYTYGETSLIEGGKQSNRLSSTQVGNGTASTPEACQHDAHGNMVHMPHIDGGLAGPNMHWDYKDQLRQIDLGGGGAAFYVYDAGGQRLRKVWEKAPGLTEERIYLGGFEIFRKHNGPISTNTAVVERETLHVMDDKQRIVLVETRKLDTAGDDQAPRQLIRFQFSNHLGSASLELDGHAQIISYEEYAPYGSSTYQAVRSQTETPKRYRFTGKERDEENGFYYYGSRYYAPWLGRWSSADPLGLVDGPNQYSYVRNNASCLIDVQGNRAGNPGKVIGTEVHDGIVYQRFQAVKGTWVSASLRQLGYDKTYGKNVAFGAYLGIAKGLDMKPLSTPDKIRPGQQYLISVGTVVNFGPDEIIGYHIPTTKLSVETWQESSAKRRIKNPGPPSEDLPYGTFELQGPKPPTTDRRGAVAFWLSQHKDEIVRAEAKWGVSRLAIAGAIAWEAINNPTGPTINALIPLIPGKPRSVGAGKIHDDPNSWAGLVGQLLYGSSYGGSLMLRARGKDPAFAIDFIGAAMFAVASIAEAHGFNIRNDAGILGQAYHSYTPQEWDKKLTGKKPTDIFELQKGTMGEWIPQNRKYLESAVGAPEYQ
jgi:RHS repeat-associated protein